MQRKPILKAIPAFCLVMTIALAGSLAAQETTLTAAQVPAAVRDGFRRAYPNATARKYSSERENGRTVYEIESVEGTTHRDLLLSADGTILETETLLTLAQLPAPVRAAAEAGGRHIQRAELTVAGQDTTYEIVIQGRRGELKFLGDGRPAPATVP